MNSRADLLKLVKRNEAVTSTRGRYGRGSCRMEVVLFWQAIDGRCVAVERAGQVGRPRFCRGSRAFPAEQTAPTARCRWERGDGMIMHDGSRPEEPQQLVLDLLAELVEAVERCKCNDVQQALVIRL